MTDFNSRNNRAVWFDIPVADLERAQAFYRAVLGIIVHKEKAGEIHFAILDHQDGNGGCLIVAPEQISSTGGVLVYLNVEQRIRSAVSQAEKHGGKVVEPIRSLGPHGVRAIILDSEGNRVALHSTVDA